MFFFSKKLTSTRKSLLSKVAVVILLVLIVLPTVAMPLTAHADGESPLSGCSLTGVGTSLLSSSFLTTALSLASPGTAGIAAARSIAGTPKSPDGSPIATCLAGVLYIFFVLIPSEFAALAGWFFDFTLALTLQGGIYNSDFINRGWTVARDLANMAFVFLLIYVAFQMILDIAHAGVGKTIAKILAVALLINFSFFFSRVVIDASNMLAHQFYQSIAAKTISATGGVQSVGGGIFVGTQGGSAQPLQIREVSSQIMAAVNIQSLFNNASFKQFISTVQKTNGWQTFAVLSTIFIGFGIMTLIMIFVFLASGVKFIGRIVMLWLAVMLAPLGFIAWIVPGLEKRANQWWMMLIKNAFFAPAFALLLLITISITLGTCGPTVVGNCQPGVLTGLGSAFSGLGSSGASTAAGGLAFSSFLQGMVIIIMRLGIVVALLMGALKIGDYFGQVSAQTVVNTAKKYATSGYQGKALGAAYSYTVGEGANKVASTLKSSRWANNPNSTLSRWVGYGAQKAAKGVAGASIGKAESTLARNKRIGEEKTAMAANAKDIENKEIVKQITTANDTAKWSAIPKATQERMIATVQGMGKRELESLKATDLIGIAHLMKEDQVKDLQKSEKLNDQQKASIGEAWNKRQKNDELGSKDAMINQVDRLTDEIKGLEASLALPTRLSTVVAAGDKVDNTVIREALDGGGGFIGARQYLNTADVDLQSAQADLTAKMSAQTQSLTQPGLTAAQRAALVTAVNNAKRDLAAAQASKRNAEKLVKKIEELDEKRKKLGPDQGNPKVLPAGADAANAGEYYAHP